MNHTHPICLTSELAETKRQLDAALELVRRLQGDVASALLCTDRYAGMIRASIASVITDLTGVPPC